jgi:hypothetical protein
MHAMAFPITFKDPIYQNATDLDQPQVCLSTLPLPFSLFAISHLPAQHATARYEILAAQIKLDEMEVGKTPEGPTAPYQYPYLTTSKRPSPEASSAIPLSLAIGLRLRRLPSPYRTTLEYKRWQRQFRRH